MDKFVIRGGKKLNGVISVSGNKNEALPALAATVLTDEPVILRNLPGNGDVLTLMDLLRSAGAAIKRIAPNDYEICCVGFDCGRLDEGQCSSLRAAILLAAPFITRSDDFFLRVGQDNRFIFKWCLRSGIRSAFIFLMNYCHGLPENELIID